MQPSRVCFRAEQMRQVCSPKQQGISGAELAALD